MSMLTMHPTLNKNNVGLPRWILESPGGIIENWMRNRLVQLPKFGKLPFLSQNRPKSNIVKLAINLGRFNKYFAAILNLVQPCDTSIFSSGYPLLEEIP